MMNKPLAKAQHHKLVSNVFSNWATNIVGAVCGFLLAPVMVHHLGDTGYGIWAFGMQLTTYLSVLDFGLRSSVGRFLTHHHTRGERDQINAVMSVATLLLSGLALLCIAASIIVAIFLDHIIKIPGAMLMQARWTVLLVSWMVALTLPGAIFAGAIASLSRYDLLNMRYIASIIIRFAITWFVLVRGGGIISIALVWLLVTIFSLVCDVAIASRLYGGFRFKLSGEAYRSTSKTLFAFSAYVFILAISTRLVLWSDNIVIAKILGLAAVTFYAIGANLADLARGALNAMTMVFVPLATSYDAKGDAPALRRLLLRGSLMGVLVVLPAIVAFFVVGRDFITLWMGPRYALIAGAVMMLLAIPVLLAPLQATSNQILYGINRHQLYARIAIVEAVVNLGLSIFLAYKVGVVGVAWGTMIPAVIVEGIIVPSYTARVLKQPVFELYWNSWMKPVLLSSPYAVWLILLHQLGWSNSWHGFAGTIASGLVIYGATIWSVLLSPSERQELVQRFKRTPPAVAGVAT